MSLKNAFVVSCATAFLATMGLLAGPQPASAAGVHVPAILLQDGETARPVEKVGHRRGVRRRFRRGGRRGYYRRGGSGRGYYRGGGRRYGYHRGRHGPRFRHRRGRYGHFYDGYWYAFPWWLGTGAYYGYYEPYYSPEYYVDPAPQEYGDRCSYWARRCSENWSRRSDYRGCLRHHGCL